MKKLGYLRGGRLTVLEPQRKVERFRPDFATGDASAVESIDQTQVNSAITYYQVAANLFKDGGLARRSEDATLVRPLPAEESADAASVAATGKVVVPAPVITLVTQ
ncbi:hypothetical protein [Rhodanobacter thiooxydans]|uniref:hypothetical protein n=1 Tax=Rhodanobacter thiooxydans TaxID=416169 RepID=UPI000316AEB5